MTDHPVDPSTVTIHAPVPSECAYLLQCDALSFLAALHKQFDEARRGLLAHRMLRQRDIDAGEYPDFLQQTSSIRDDHWTVASIPADLLDRRVEITGPVERKMVINALNSGASCFMADLEDSNSPTWLNNLAGQKNLHDAVNGDIEYLSPEGKLYALAPGAATLIVRPRGWHLTEKHFLVNGAEISGSLFDFGLYFFHNVKALLAKGSGPYFYLPKIQSHLEARLWNDVFAFAQEYMGVPRGSIRATVLIETILAAFEMDEILYELREHAGGLNCGRWDYIFSFIKTFRNSPDFVLPDRSQVTMDRHFLKSYVYLLIQTCHRRGVHAMGGMAAQIPIKFDTVANERAFEKVRQDKLREVLAGHDGTWVAHPGLVSTAREVFDEHMRTPNQIHVKRNEIDTKAADLLDVPKGEITYAGLCLNIDVGIRYLESWLGGQGCVPIHNLMEDAATAEISRTQIWQWHHYARSFSDGRAVTTALVREVIASQLDALRGTLGADAYARSRFDQAAELFEHLVVDNELKDFMTVEAYKRL